MNFDKVVSDYPLLSIKEEQTLLTEYATTGNVSIRNKLVYHNIRLVLKSAKRFFPKTPDLINEGIIGLIAGIDKYDTNRGTKLSTYVTWWINAYMYQYVLSHRLVRLPNGNGKTRKLFFNLKKEEQNIFADGIESSSVDLAKKFDVNEEDIGKMDGYLKDPISIDNNSVSVSKLSTDVTPDQQYDSAESDYLISNEFTQSLKPREKIIFRRRLIEEASLHEVGEEVGVSRERVRQIESDLIVRLRRFAKNNGLDSLVA